MIVADGLMIILIIILAIKLWNCENRLDLANDDIEESVAEIRELKQRCDTHKKSIEYLSKSVRELNGVVEAAVKVKEETSDNKPDVEALIGGWMTDDGSTEIDASYIRTGLIDGKSVMNCELPNISDSDYEKICELFGAKAPDVDTVLGFAVSGDVVWLDKRGHVHYYSAYGD